MTFPKLLRHIFLIASVLMVSLVLHETKAAPSSFSGASAGGTGALAGTDEYGQAVAMSGVPVGAPAGGSGYGQSTSLLSRSGGGSSQSQRTQSVLVGSNGGTTTVLQQTGDQPAKVYKISG